MALLRADLDRMLVEAGAAQVRIACHTHPEVGVDFYYKDGEGRLLCKACGFEVQAVKIAE